MLYSQDNNKLSQWLGNKICPYVQDTFLELDAPWQKDYVIHSIRNDKGLK